MPCANFEKRKRFWPSSDLNREKFVMIPIKWSKRASAYATWPFVIVNVFILYIDTS